MKSSASIKQLYFDNGILITKKTQKVTIKPAQHKTERVIALTLLDELMNTSTDERGRTTHGAIVEHAREGIKNL